MTEFTRYTSLVEAIDGARSEMLPGDTMKLCRAPVGECTREEGCDCPVVAHGDLRSTAEIVSTYFGVTQ